MAVKFCNNFASTLSSGINSSATTISVASAAGLPSLSGNDYLYLTIDTDTGSPTREIVKVTAISSNDLTVVRGQDGTSATSFDAGTKIELRVTAAALHESVSKAVDDLVDSAPGALDTLNELAAALGDDANFSTTVTNSIATKVPLAGGTMTGNLTVPNLSVTSTNYLGFGDYGERLSGNNVAGTLTFYTDATLALTLDNSQNASFAGTVTSETTTGDATFVAYRNQTTLPNSGDGSNLIGAYLFKSSDSSGSEPHYAGVGGFADQYGRMELQFFTERDHWDSDPRVPTLTLDRNKDATFAGGATFADDVDAPNYTTNGYLGLSTTSTGNNYALIDINDTTFDYQLRQYNGSAWVTSLSIDQVNQKATFSGTLDVNGSSNSNFYALQLERSGSGTAVDIWGTNNKLVIGTSSTATALALASGDTTVTGQMYIGPNNADRRPFAKKSNWGYSSSYKAIILGSTSTAPGTEIDGATTISFGYDPSTNSDGSFTGDGREILFRNGQTFVTPNSANDDFNQYHLVLKDGRVGIGENSPDVPLHVSLGAEPPAAGMLILEANSSGRQLRIQPPTDSDNGFIDYRGGNLTFLDDGSETMRFASGGNIVVGHSTVESSIWNITPRLQIEGNNASTSAISIVRNTESASPPYLVLTKTRGGTNGSDVSVQDDDTLGHIVFSGADGTDRASQGGSIACKVDGTPGTGDMPGRLEFYTTQDGAELSTLALTINSEQQAIFAGGISVTGVSNVQNTFTIGGSGFGTLTYGTIGSGSAFGIRSGSGKDLSIGAGGSWDVLRLSAAGDATFSGDITFDGGKKIGLERVGGAEATVGPGWMTVATNTSGRRHGEIIVTDADSGDHGFIRIDWMRSYWDSNFTVLNTGGHSNRITGCRVLREDGNSTYGTKILQVYVTVSSTYEVDIYHHHGTTDYSAHTAVTPVIEDTKTGYSVFGNQLEDLDTYGFATEEGIRAGGKLAVGDGHTIGDDGDDNLVLASSAGENLILDSGNSIYLDHDSDSADSIYLRRAGANYAYFRNSSDDLLIGPTGEDHDIFFQGNDGGSTINMLRLDASEYGYATFSGHAELGGKLTVSTTMDGVGAPAAGTGILGATAAYGAILTGQGSTNDITISNDAGQSALAVPTGTRDVVFSGNVGIGSTNPDGVLDLGNATAGRGIVWGGTTGNSNYGGIWSEYGSASIIIGAGLKSPYPTANAGFRVPYTGTYGYAAIELDSWSDDGMKFYVGPDAAVTKDDVITPVERMRIATNGRVGIGTTSPESLLHLGGESPTLTLKDATYDCTLKAYAQDTKAIIGTYSSNVLEFYSNSARALALDIQQNAIFDGQVYINGGSNNLGKADFSVATGGSTGGTIAIAGDEIRIGNTDVNWNAKLSYEGSTYLRAWNNSIAITVNGGSSDQEISIWPSNAGTAVRALTVQPTTVTVDRGYLQVGGSIASYGRIEAYGSSGAYIDLTANTTHGTDDYDARFIYGSGFTQITSKTGNLDIHPQAGTTYIRHAGSVAFETISEGVTVRDTSGADAMLRLNDSSNSYLGRVYANATNNRFGMYSYMHGAKFYFRGEDAGGTAHTCFWADPDDETYLYYDGSWKARTQSGGFQINGSLSYNSDRRLKKDITPISGALDAVLSLKGVNYTLIDSDTKHIGFVAQDIQADAPSWLTERVVVESSSNDETAKRLGAIQEGESVEMLALNYANMVALLTEAMKEQQTQIEALTKRIKELEDK